MRKLKKWIILGAVIFYCMGLNVSGEDARYMTKAKFVDLVIRIMDLEMMLPSDVDLLSTEEFYKLEIELLGRRGICDFLGSQPSETVKRRELVNFLYLAIVKKVPGDITDEEKLGFLVKKGFLSKGNLDEIMTEKEIIKALNIPELVTAIAETYIAPGSAEVVFEIEFREPGELYEEPASPIY